MGEGYRARDTKLNRDVALKVLPVDFALDADRRARFTREAQLLASLNHPNIAAIYGLEDSGDTHALVLELVEGETLADRIARGTIPNDEALPLAQQICEALEAAHEHGVIHRDLKPSNIKVRPDGTVKVLDFGLAKLNEPNAPNVSNTASLSPTITSPPLITGVGVLLGTAAYMAPEQARGRAVDKRADIWAFGCVLFEMLSGQRPFAGDDAADIIVAVLSKDPDWASLPARTPSRIRVVLQQCMTKDPRQRLRDIGDARIALGSTIQATAENIVSTAHRSSRARLAWSVAATALLIAGLTIAWTASQRVVTPPIQKLSMLAPEGVVVYELAISPDGSHVAFAARSGGRRALWVRALDSLEATALSGTEDAALPFWSPDSKSIGFFAQNKLKRVAGSGGPVQTLADAPSA